MQPDGVVPGTGIGPTPWYWKTFPGFAGPSGRRYRWRRSALLRGPVVTLCSAGFLAKPRLALGYYVWPFPIPGGFLGVCFEEASSLRLLSFDPDRLVDFRLSDLPASFNAARSRYFAASQPLAQMLITGRPEGTYQEDFPWPFDRIEEILVPVTYTRDCPEVPPTAAYVLRPSRGEFAVHLQKWFTGAEYDLGYQWITRLWRDPETGRIRGDGIRIDPFELAEDGCHLLGTG